MKETLMIREIAGIAKYINEENVQEVKGKHGNSK
jgi:hypothetical protein